MDDGQLRMQSLLECIVQNPIAVDPAGLVLRSPLQIWILPLLNPARNTLKIPLIPSSKDKAHSNMSSPAFITLSPHVFFQLHFQMRRMGGLDSALSVLQIISSSGNSPAG